MDSLIISFLSTSERNIQQNVVLLEQPSLPYKEENNWILWWISLKNKRVVKYDVNSNYVVVCIHAYFAEPNKICRHGLLYQLTNYFSYLFYQQMSCFSLTNVKWVYCIDLYKCIGSICFSVQKISIHIFLYLSKPVALSRTMKYSCQTIYTYKLTLFNLRSI